MLGYLNTFTSVEVTEPDALVITIEIIIDDKWKLLTPEEMWELYPE